LPIDRKQNGYGYLIDTKWVAGKASLVVFPKWNGPAALAGPFCPYFYYSDGVEIVGQVFLGGERHVSIKALIALS
jgi:hypothetical protein